VNCSPDANAESVDVASRLAVSTVPLRIRVSRDRRYLTAGQVRERFGVSDMWIWRHIRVHGFPRPVQFGGPTSARHWLVTDIEHWEQSKAVRS
jgi:predicted DNA-binding transcriptional regulator AlpA